MARKPARRTFGSIRQLPSRHYQARYTDPNGVMRKAPVTFDARIDAEAWLARQRGEIVQGTWLPPVSKTGVQNLPLGGEEWTTELDTDPTFGAYAVSWLRTRKLATTTRDHYAQLLRDHILPTFKSVSVSRISPAEIRHWVSDLKTGPTAKAHAYGLLRTILATAVADDVIPVNPCRVRGAGRSKAGKQYRPASLTELETIANSVPSRYRLMVLFAAWCALRFGELAELRRSDIDVKNAVIHVRRGVTRTKGGRVVGDPKTEAGKRTVAIPPHLMPEVKRHLRDHVGIAAQNYAPAGNSAPVTSNDAFDLRKVTRPADNSAPRDPLLFPAASGGHMAPASLYRVFYPAREAAGRPDLRFHDLRHTGATMAAVSGATLKELMARLGHSTPAAAMRYQHAAADRDKAIAAALSKLAADVIPISRTRARRKPAAG
jgi:integrase